SCEALIFPSIWYEGMPITILEAFSCGTPVIASNIGSLQSLVEDHKNGLHFTAGEPDDLRSKIAYWASLDIASKDTLHLSTSFIYNKKYTAEKNMDQLINIYKEAVQ